MKTVSLISQWILSIDTDFIDYTYQDCINKVTERNYLKTANYLKHLTQKEKEISLPQMLSFLSKIKIQNNFTNQMRSIK